MYSQSSGVITTNENLSSPSPKKGGSVVMRLFWITIGLLVIGGGIFFFFLIKDSEVTEEDFTSPLTLEERAEALMKLNTDFASSNPEGYSPLTVEERQNLLSELNQSNQGFNETSSVDNNNDEEVGSIEPINQGSNQGSTDSSSSTSSQPTDSSQEERMNALKALSELE